MATAAASPPSAVAGDPTTNPNPSPNPNPGSENSLNPPHHPPSTPTDASIANPNPNPMQCAPPAPVQSLPAAPVPPPAAVPGFALSYRPLVAPAAPHYSAITNPSAYFPPGVAPPVQMIAAPPVYPGHHPVGAIPRPPYGSPYMHLLPPGHVPPPGQLPPVIGPPGIPRYPAPYPHIAMPGYSMRAPMMIPPISRPPVPGIRPTIVAPPVRPPIPMVIPTEKPQTTVYVGKIASTVDNDFLLSILRLCGPVKSWKRAQDPSDGTPKGFGFCEFEAAEGILRALRLLSKLNIDGQELVLNNNQATREYLERYVERKTQREKFKETEDETGYNGNEAILTTKQDPLKPVAEESKTEADDAGDKENQDGTTKFGIVTDEDLEADRDALEKISTMVEERLKAKPLPPPPPPPTSVALANDIAKSNSEARSRSKDRDSDVDIIRNAEEKNDDETSSEFKSVAERDRSDINSPDRDARHDRRSRDRDRERDRDYESRRERERELERYERDRERERYRRERDRDHKVREAERLYKDRVKEWEGREREKEHLRKREREREKDRERERQREISKQEDENDDDDTRKRRRRSSAYEDRKRRRLREKEDDMVDRLKEDKEIVEAKKRAAEENLKMDDLKPASIPVNMEIEKDALQDGFDIVNTENAVIQTVENPPSNDDELHMNGIGNELIMEMAEPPAALDPKQNGAAPTKKLGFGLVGSGKRTAVTSVFHVEDDEDVDEKKMRPLVPLDYSTEELQAVQTNASGAQMNLVAAAEFAKRISGVNSKEEKFDMDKERSKRPSEKSSHRERERERERNYEESSHTRDENKEKAHDKASDREKDRDDRMKTDNKKLFDAKQLIDTIPRTKEELFAYEMNWDVYDRHKLHERMRPWISKKITDYLGEEEETLVEYIVTSTKDHVEASRMFQLLQSILDEEAEMFVLKMWRMLIFEIKKVETGLSEKSRA